jgi:hypothetical protein
MKPCISWAWKALDQQQLEFLSVRFEECKTDLYLSYGSCSPDTREHTIVYENAMLTNQSIIEPVYSRFEKIARWIGRALRLATLARFHERDTIVTCDFVAEKVYRIGD